MKYKVNYYDVRAESWHKFYRNDASESHREAGSAVLIDNGAQGWYKDGKRHREVGPAFIYSTGKGEFWYEGVLKE